MHYPDLFVMLENVRTTVFHFFAQDDDIPIWNPFDEPGPANPSRVLMTWKGRLEVITALLCMLCSLSFFIFYSFAHARLRAQNKHLLRRKSLWTPDQVNACIIPLGIGMMFAVIYYLFR